MKITGCAVCGLYTAGEVAGICLCGQKLITMTEDEAADQVVFDEVFQLYRSVKHLNKQIQHLEGRPDRLDDIKF